jgi:hypothetical protein
VFQHAVDRRGSFDQLQDRPGVADPSERLGSHTLTAG